MAVFAEVSLFRMRTCCEKTGEGMKTCVIVGQNYPDAGLQRILGEYHRVVIFEPIPDAAKACREACGALPGVTVFEAACGEMFCNATFNLYNAQGLSSSLGEMTPDAADLYGHQYDLSLRGKIDVQILHLGFMLQLMGVEVIDFLLIDAQGMDFTILKTVEPWLAESRVKLIQLEADGNGFRHYDGLPDNSDSAVMRWMERYPRYEASRLEGRLEQQPDLVFELMKG